MLAVERPSVRMRKCPDAKASGRGVAEIGLRSTAWQLMPPPAVERFAVGAGGAFVTPVDP